MKWSIPAALAASALYAAILYQEGLDEEQWRDRVQAANGGFVCVPATHLDALVDLPPLEVKIDLEGEACAMCNGCTRERQWYLVRVETP